MYLVYVLADILEGRLTRTKLGSIKNLPRGLKSYYEHHWKKMRAVDNERFEKFYQPVICQLAVVREPVSVSQLAAWEKFTPFQIKEVLREWRQFLNESETESGESIYRIYHSSFQDFLREEVELKPYTELIVDEALNKIPGFRPQSGDRGTV